MKKSAVILLYLASFLPVRGEDGYDLWLRYHLTDNTSLLQQYRASIPGILFKGNSAILSAAGQELSVGLQGLLGKTIPVQKDIRSTSCIVIATNSGIGAMYGVFHFLRLLQTHQPIKSLSVLSSPRIEQRILNHWDNLNRVVERDYAGFSIRFDRTAAGSNALAQYSREVRRQFENINTCPQVLKNLVTRWNIMNHLYPGMFLLRE